MIKRLFVAIDLPNSTRQLLAALDPQVRGVHWTDPVQMHLTLSFLGDVPDEPEAALREKLSLIKFGAFFAHCWRGNVFCKRYGENYLDRRR